MKKITQLLLWTFLALGTPHAVADDGVEVTRLTVTLTSGVQEHYEFPDHPEVTFPESRMEVKTDIVRTAYERTEVANYGFTRGLRGSAITDAATGGDYLFRYSAPVVSISGSNVTAATVVSASGVTVSSAHAENGVITIDLSSLPAGVYVVAPEGHRAVKIKK